MRRSRKRAPRAPRLESLEVRALMSVQGLGSAGGLEADPARFAADRILVRTWPGAPSTLGDEVAPGLRAVPLAAGSGVAEALAAYRTRPEVRYAEPDYEVRVTAIPNDPSFGSLYGLHNTGQSGGRVDADVDAPEAWDVTTGSGRAVVAVIDTGVDYNHPDLAANIWNNPGEFGGNGLDDDGNGFVDDVHGYDFVNNDGDPMDDNNHGTHVSGTIGAVGNNGVGVTGVNWRVQIMALKFLNASGSGSTSAAISSLNYAVANGATISNNSWGGGGFSQALFDAINNARSAGHVFVAAAGNDGTNNDATPSYPASYNLDNVIAVASTDRNDARSSFSNYGATSVDLAAPGSSILSTTRNNTYSTFSGTSMATPHVAGAVALVADLYPTLTYRQVIDRILTTVDPIAGLAGLVATGGRLNLARAVAPPTDQAGARVTAGTLGGTVAGPVSSTRLTFSEAINASTFTGADAVITTPGGSTVVATGVAAVAGSNNTQFDVTFPSQSAVGSYSLRVGPAIDDAAGNPMNQDGDAINGEAADAYTATFAIDDRIGSDAVYDARAATYEAIDLVPGAAGVTTLLTSGDDSTVTASLGGSFNFYGTTYTTASISTNGLITFGGANSSYSNTDLTSSPSQRAIAVLWDDWISSSGNSALLRRLDDTNGDGTADRVVFEWNKLRGYSASPSQVTFQAILQLNTGATPGAITLNYPDLDAGDARTNGGSATVGIKDVGTQGARRLLISQNSATNPNVRSGRAIRFTPKPAGTSTAASAASTRPAVSATAAGRAVGGMVVVADPIATIAEPAVNGQARRKPTTPWA